MCAVAQVTGSVEEGVNPPWNYPQVTPFVFNRSPTFLPVICTVSRVEQSSKKGCGSPITDQSTTSWLMSPVPPSMAPWVWPAMRFKCPGVDGPKVVLKELSLIAKCCA